MLKIKQLEEKLNNYNLTEYLKNCSTEELNYFIRIILCDDITSTRAKIYDALLTEIEYRKISLVMKSDYNNEKIYMLIDNYKNDLQDIKLNDIKKSVDFYEKEGIYYNDVLNWFPAGLSVEMCYTIYKFMSENGMETDKIINVLVGNFKKTKNLYNKIKGYAETENNDFTEDKNFINFMIQAIKTIMQQKHKTESFKKIYEKLNAENSDVIKRLM